MRNELKAKWVTAFIIIYVAGSIGFPIYYGEPKIIPVCLFLVPILILALILVVMLIYLQVLNIIEFLDD